MDPGPGPTTHEPSIDFRGRAAGGSPGAEAMIGVLLAMAGFGWLVGLLTARRAPRVWLGAVLTGAGAAGLAAVFSFTSSETWDVRLPLVVATTKLTRRLSPAATVLVEAEKVADVVESAELPWQVHPAVDWPVIPALRASASGRRRERRSRVIQAPQVRPFCHSPLSNGQIDQTF